MGNYAKISPIRRSRSITSYQEGEILFKTLIEIGHIPYVGERGTSYIVPVKKKVIPKKVL